MAIASARAVSRALMVSRGWILALLLLAAGAGVGAQALPSLTKPVNDFAGVIDGASASELDRRIRALEKGTSTHDAVVVATVDSIAPYDSIEDYAIKLFERAGIGQKGLNNGVLIVMARTERKVRIEVGYDLEQFVTDGFSGDVIRQDMLPAFRRGEFGPGILAGATRVINRIAEGRGVTLTDVPAAAARQEEKDPAWLKFVPILFIIVLVIISMIRGGGPRSGYRRHNPWGGFGGPFIGGLGGGFGGGGFGGGGFGGGGGGGGGGFGGFGGGSSGGGGGSGSW
jgi:uncharacterized protein